MKDRMASWENRTEKTQNQEPEHEAAVGETALKFLQAVLNSNFAQNVARFTERHAGYWLFGVNVNGPSVNGITMSALNMLYLGALQSIDVDILANDMTAVRRDMTHGNPVKAQNPCRVDLLALPHVDFKIQILNQQTTRCLDRSHVCPCAIGVRHLKRLRSKLILGHHLRRH